jgi:hypothetical protein
MNTKRHSSSNQHGSLSLTVRAQPRPIDRACASGPRVHQSRGCHYFYRLGHDLLCDLSLLRDRRASSSIASIIILLNTQRSKKWRKGKRASSVVIAFLSRSFMCVGLCNWRWSPFCASVMRQQLIMKLLPSESEGLKGRTGPCGGVFKILSRYPFGCVRE